MAVASAMPRLQLTGFNNLTKTLSFNSYEVRYAATPAQQNRYRAYIDEAYNAERLTGILRTVARIIGGNILNIARQDYEPQGASVALLISEGAAAPDFAAEWPGPWPNALLGHLDKSHITVHTYPESHPDHGINTCRTDIDVSTCGRISPLHALNDLMAIFKPDVVSIDYRVRGFTRDVAGNKHFIDHPIRSIQDFLSTEIGGQYQMVDVNVSRQQFFHTRMLCKALDRQHDRFSVEGEEAMSLPEPMEIARRLRQEMTEIFSGEAPPEGSWSGNTQTQ